MENIDFNKIKNMPIYIPYVNANITENDIKILFRIHQIGEIKKIQLFGKSLYINSAVIHFDYWYLNKDNYYIQKYINDDSVQEVRILYDADMTRSFWILREYIEQDLNTLRLKNGGPMLGDGFGLHKRQRINILK
jgi:hypothetical protein